MNHMYMISLELYSEAGAPIGEMTYVYKDNPVDFCHAVDAYKAMKQENGQKMYKVTPQILAYAVIDDMAAFKAANHII